MDCVILKFADMDVVHFNLLNIFYFLFHEKIIDQSHIRLNMKKGCEKANLLLDFVT